HVPDWRISDVHVACGLPVTGIRVRSGPWPPSVGGNMQADCTFCQIVSGELPADLVDEDERTVAFMDISPATLGHLLVVPRRHVGDVMAADPGDWLAGGAMGRGLARGVGGAWWA